MNLLEIKNMKTSFFIEAGEVKAVRGIDLHIEKGETLGIVGESGSGKSVAMLSILQLLEKNARITADYINFCGENLLEKNRKNMRELSGNSIGMIFQDPLTSLNPIFTIGNQIIEPLKIHKKLKNKEDQMYLRLLFSTKRLK